MSIRDYILKVMAFWITFFTVLYLTERKVFLIRGIKMGCMLNFFSPNPSKPPGISTDRYNRSSILCLNDLIYSFRFFITLDINPSRIYSSQSNVSMGNSVNRLREPPISQKRNCYPLKKSLLAFFALAFLTLNSSQALMVKLSLQRLTVGSDAIILGEVENIQCEWSLDKQIILSVVTLQIHEILKGDFSSSKIFIQYPGGTMGEISLKVTDMPSFFRKEKVLVFLKSITDMTDMKNSPLVTLNILPAFKVFGNAQGKYFIDARAMAQRSGDSSTAQDADPDRTLSLTELKTKIKSILMHQSEEREKIHDRGKH